MWLPVLFGVWWLGLVVGLVALVVHHARELRRTPRPVRDRGELTGLRVPPEWTVR